MMIIYVQISAGGTGMEMHIDRPENGDSLRSPHLLKGRRGRGRKQVCEASALPLVESRGRVTRSSHESRGETGTVASPRYFEMSAKNMS